MFPGRGGAGRGTLKGGCSGSRGVQHVGARGVDLGARAMDAGANCSTCPTRPAHPDTPAPVRFLPAFDNATLGCRDRRIIDNAHLGLSAAEREAVHAEAQALAVFHDAHSDRVHIAAGTG